MNFDEWLDTINQDRITLRETYEAGQKSSLKEIRRLEEYNMILARELLALQQILQNFQRAGTALKNGKEYDVYIDLSGWTIEEDTKKIIKNIFEGRKL